MPSPRPGHRLRVCFDHGDHLMLFDLWDSPEELYASAANPAAEHIAIAAARPFDVHRLVDHGPGPAVVVMAPGETLRPRGDVR
jgi:hypothetical protein